MKEILIAVLFLAAIALACGILLVLAARFFRVKEDHAFDNIRACLPGANCGSCGFTGCDGYAHALAEGKTKKINLCTPGADKTAQELAKLLGVEFEDVVEQVAFVQCRGDCFKTAPKQEYVGIPTCAAAKTIFGGQGNCTFGCLGFGDCAAVCPQSAICLENGIAHVDTRKCIGCGMCASKCPNHLIHLVPDISRVTVNCSNREKGAAVMQKCSAGCIGCGKCQRNCPSGAIRVENNLAVIDYALCTGCGICADGCPVHCISHGDLSGASRA